MDGKPQKKIKILFAIANLGIGGAERMVVNQLNSIDRTVFDPHLVTFISEGTHSFLSEVRLPQKNIHFFYFSSYGNMWFWAQLIWWMRREKFDIVFSNLILANNVTRIAARIFGVSKIIVAEHNLYPDKKWMQLTADRFLAVLTHTIVAGSYSTKNFLVRRGIPAPKIKVVYDGIDTHIFDGVKETKQKLRQRFGFSDDTVIILSVGRGSIQKAYDVLIETAAELQNRTEKKFRFIVVGRKNPQLQDGLESKVREFQLGTRVEFWGIRRDIPELLSASDIFFLPSRWEGFGMVLIEAMSAGLPFVASEVGVVSAEDRRTNGISDGEHGFIVGDYKPENFALQLFKLIEHVDLRQKMGDAARLRAQDFSIERNIEQFQKLCLNAVTHS